MTAQIDLTETKLVLDRKLVTVSGFLIHSIRPHTDLAQTEPGYTLVCAPPARPVSRIVFETHMNTATT